METDICLTLCSHDTANMEVTSLPWNNEVLVAFWDFFFKLPQVEVCECEILTFHLEKNGFQLF